MSGGVLIAPAGAVIDGWINAGDDPRTWFARVVERRSSTQRSVLPLYHKRRRQIGFFIYPSVCPTYTREHRLTLHRWRSHCPQRGPVIDGATPGMTLSIVYPTIGTSIVARRVASDRTFVYPSVYPTYTREHHLMLHRWCSHCPRTWFCMLSNLTIDYIHLSTTRRSVLPLYHIKRWQIGFSFIRAYAHIARRDSPD